MFLEMLRDLDEAYSRLSNYDGHKTWTKGSNFNDRPTGKYAHGLEEYPEKQKKIIVGRKNDQPIYAKYTSSSRPSKPVKPEELSYKMMAWVLRGGLEEGNTSANDVLKAVKDHKDIKFEGKIAAVTLKAKDDDYNIKFLALQKFGFYEKAVTYEYPVKSKNLIAYLSWFTKNS